MRAPAPPNPCTTLRCAPQFRRHLNETLGSGGLLAASRVRVGAWPHPRSPLSHRLHSCPPPGYFRSFGSGMIPPWPLISRKRQPDPGLSPSWQVSLSSWPLFNPAAQPVACVVGERARPCTQPLRGIPGLPQVASRQALHLNRPQVLRGKTGG